MCGLSVAPIQRLRYGSVKDYDMKAIELSWVKAWNDYRWFPFRAHRYIQDNLWRWLLRVISTNTVLHGTWGRSAISLYYVKIFHKIMQKTLTRAVLKNMSSSNMSRINSGLTLSKSTSPAATMSLTLCLVSSYSFGDIGWLIMDTSTAKSQSPKNLIIVIVMSSNK